MKDRLKNGIALALFPQIVLVKWLGSYPELIEKYYSHGIYPIFSESFRWLLGWLPFSFGDLAYAILIFLGFRYLFIRRKKIKMHPKAFLRDIAMVFSVIYFSFHLLWGLNYYRVPLLQTLGVKEVKDHNKLVTLTEQLIDKTNALHYEISGDAAKKIEFPYSQPQMFEITLKGYKDLERSFPFLQYSTPSIKTSVFSTLLTYMGYGGYINPFTQEAQVNAKLPNFRFPVVVGHEIGHQLGYSAENETNFIGYLVTVQNKDRYFQYTAYAYALGYCLNSIQKRDKARFKALYAQISQGVQKDYTAMQKFWKAHDNPMEPVFKAIFNAFLKANNQTEGIKSYGKVVTLLVSYHEEHPL